MRAFIFDKFGYYEDDEYGIEFDYKGWHFQLELTDRTEQDVFKMKEFLKNITLYFPNFGADIISSRDNKLIVDSNFGRVSLVSVKNGNYNLNDIYTFHKAFVNFASTSSYKISYIKKVWETKTDHIEEKILPRIKYNDNTYSMLMENIAHASGLAENAIQYLMDTITFYGDNVLDITLTHKRLTDKNTYTFLNPFNMVVDSPARDLADIIKYDLCDFATFQNFLSNYNLSKSSASILLARLLYPTELYDMLEEHHLVKHDISSRIVHYYKNRDKMMQKIKKVHDFLVDSYQIKPIEWLN